MSNDGEDYSDGIEEEPEVYIKKKKTFCGVKKRTLKTLLQIILPCSILLFSFLFIVVCYPIFLFSPENFELQYNTTKNGTSSSFQFYVLSPSEFTSSQPNSGLAVFFAVFVSFSLGFTFARKYHEIMTIRKRFEVTCPVLLNPILILHAFSNVVTAITLIGMASFPMDRNRPSYLLVHLIFELIFYHSIAILFMCWVSEEILWYRSFRSVPIWILWQLRCVVTIISVVLVIVFWVFFVFVLVDGLDGVEFKDLKMSIPITYWYEALEYTEFAMIFGFFLMVTVEVCYIKRVASIALKKMNPIPLSKDEEFRSVVKNRPDERMLRKMNINRYGQSSYDTSYSSNVSSSSPSSSSSDDDTDDDDDDESITHHHSYEVKKKKKVSPVKKLLKNIPVISSMVRDTKKSPMITTISSSPIKHPRKRHSPPRSKVHHYTLTSPKKTSPHIHRQPVKRVRYSPRKSKNRNQKKKKRSPRKKSRGEHDNIRKSRRRKKRVRFSDESGMEGSSEMSEFFNNQSSSEGGLSTSMSGGLGFGGSLGYSTTSDRSDASSLNISTDAEGFPNSFKYLTKNKQMSEEIFDRLVAGVDYIPLDS